MMKAKKEKSQNKKAVAAKGKKVAPKLAKPKALAKITSRPARKAAVKAAPAPAKPVTRKKKIALTAPVPIEQIKEAPVTTVLNVPPAPSPVREIKKEIPKPQERPAEKPHHPERRKEIRKEVPAAVKEAPVAVKEPPKIKEEPAVSVLLKEIELKFPIALKDLAVKLQEKPSTLIKVLMNMKMMVGINQLLDEDIVSQVCEKYGFKIKRAPDEEELALFIHQQPDTPAELHPRPPIVTFMGHVDHGKTSLLDAIRKTKVAETEHGGITQHIGAYRVALAHGEITFLDTPGHEAFTMMRARGAGITDIVVLVVAADDGIMPQTQEAIDHARQAGVSIVVAINKIDKPQANVDRVKKQLSEVGLAAEDWGGKTITVAVSAKTSAGIDNLLEMILLEAQMLELKANAKRPAKGVVVEAKMSKGRGPVSTLLVQNGTLHLNDNIIVGAFHGKIRAMFNDHGHSVVEAPPAFPVEVLGIPGIPAAGEQFFSLKDEKIARELALKRQERQRQEQVKEVKRINLEDLYAQIQAGKIKELKIILKADVQGSLEAIQETLNKLNISEIKLDVIHKGVGNVNSSDAILAMASNALILGFNVAADDLAKELVAKEGIDLRTYNIIYELANDIKAALEGMLEPKLKKVFVGKVEIRKVFKLSRSGTVAGCFVSKGKITRTSLIGLVRNGEGVFEGKVSSLKRFKDDVREVAEGFECGITLAGFDDLREGDVIEAYDIEKIARKL
jgi:translation initiation factor IF-2